MKTIKVKELNLGNFNIYGAFTQLIDPKAPKLGNEPIEFFRDMVQLGLGQETAASFSVCRVTKRPLVIDTVEKHNFSGEGILPLDSDVLIHVALATPNGNVPVDKIEVFRVPKGTVVSLRRGVWHHAPFALSASANVVIVLPERTYANDCYTYELTADEKMDIGMPERENLS